MPQKHAFPLAFAPSAKAPPQAAIAGTYAPSSCQGDAPTPDQKPQEATPWDVRKPGHEPVGEEHEHPRGAPT